MSPKTKTILKKARGPHPAKPYHDFCKKLRPGLVAMGLSPTQIAKECSRLWREKKLATKKMSPSKMSRSKKSQLKSTQIGGGELGKAIRTKALGILEIGDNKSDIEKVTELIEPMIKSAEGSDGMRVMYLELLRDLINNRDPDDEMYGQVHDDMLRVAREIRSEIVSGPAPGAAGGGGATGGEGAAGKEGAAGGGGAAGKETPVDDYWDQKVPPDVDTRKITEEGKLTASVIGLETAPFLLPIRYSPDGKFFDLTPARKVLDDLGYYPVADIHLGGVGPVAPIGRLSGRLGPSHILDVDPVYIGLKKGATTGLGVLAAASGSGRPHQTSDTASPPGPEDASDVSKIRDLVFHILYIPPESNERRKQVILREVVNYMRERKTIPGVDPKYIEKLEDNMGIIGTFMFQDASKYPVSISRTQERELYRLAATIANRFIRIM